jgi:hydroxymethylbilane synthase
VKKELEHHHPELTISVEVIKTTGDRILDSPLSAIGDKGLFTKEIETALLEQRIDFAVHSLKDVPTHLPSGLSIGAITKREDVRDVFISHPAKGYATFKEIPPGARIATGSLRRRCQLLSMRPDLTIVEIRGNLNTRFAKLESSDWDGMILARAGVVRLGMQDRITDTLPAEQMLPAVGQGALGIEIREDDSNMLSLLAPLASYATTVATGAERAFLRFLEGGCQVPIGTYGRIEENVFKLDAMIGSIDGKKIVRGSTQSAPEEAGNVAVDLARTLFAGGGKEILAGIRVA